MISPSDYALETDKQKKAPPLGSVLVDMQHTSSDEDDEETKADTSIWSQIRDQAMIKRNTRQAKQAQMHMKVAGMEAVKSGVGYGAIVKLIVDYRTHCHASALIGIVFGFMPETGGVTVCCEHGIITHDGSRNPYYVPIDKYAVVAKPNESIPISNELAAVRQLVLAGTYNPKIQKTISYSKYVDMEQDPSTPTGLKKKKGCGCRKGCNASCGCKKGKMKCHSGCRCNGNCGND